MLFTLEKALEILETTPSVLQAWLGPLSDAWTHQHEGPETWSPFDIVGHLIHGERTDWLPRARLILAPDGPHTFTPFDRFAQLRENEGANLSDLLDTFARLRAENLAALRAMALTEADLDREGRHPELGAVTLRQLLATWAVHDLNHLAQIARVMAKQYAAEVGPWRAYLGVLKER